MLRSLNSPLGYFSVLSDIEHERIVVIDELNRLNGRDLLVRTRETTQLRPNNQTDDDRQQREQDWVVSHKFNISFHLVSHSTKPVQSVHVAAREWHTQFESCRLSHGL